MNYKTVKLFSIVDYNNNKIIKGFYPQDGEVITVYFDAMALRNVVAVGYK